MEHFVSRRSSARFFRQYAFLYGAGAGSGAQAGGEAYAAGGGPYDGGGGEHPTVPTFGWQLIRRFLPQLTFGGGDGYVYDFGGDGITYEAAAEEIKETTEGGKCALETLR